MRLGCFLVSFAVLASLVLLPPKAKAFAMTSSAITALAGGFLSACGLTPVVSGMNNSGEVNESLARLIQEYLDAEIPGADLISWLGSRIPMRVASGNRLIIPMSVAGALREFAVWVAGKYGTKPGVNQVFAETSSYITLQDGSKFYLSVFDLIDGKIALVSKGSMVSYLELPLNFVSGYRLVFSDTVNGRPYGIKLLAPGQDDNSGGFSFSGPFSLVIGNYPGRVYAVYYSVANSSFDSCMHLSESVFGEVITADESLSLDVADTITIPDGLTDGQSIALDVGATQSMEIQGILQGILDAILAGDLAASAEIVDEAVEPEEPDPPVVPVVPSGLDKLGAALTSRFPFSIPWDVYKGVTLLAAPPKAPYFEVDFMAPIADRVGGWKGSTKIVLDFSEYEIIGQVCRWTSTIGFCLMLASGTKRLIWTA